MIATERSTNIAVTESTTCIVAIEPQNLHKLAIESGSYIVPTETATCRMTIYRNFHLQKWWHSEILLVALKKIVRQNSFSFTSIT